MQLLLKKGADVNAEGGEYGTALQAASCRGYETVVQLLLKKGADVNAEGGEYGTALQAASKNGHETVVQLLLKNGADVNAEGGEYGSALEAALKGEARFGPEDEPSYTAIVQLLRSAMESQAPLSASPTADVPTQLSEYLSPSIASSMPLEHDNPSLLSDTESQ